jgi:hypothetical protein
VREVIQFIGVKSSSAMVIQGHGDSPLRHPQCSEA